MNHILYGIISCLSETGEYVRAKKWFLSTNNSSSHLNLIMLIHCLQHFQSNEYKLASWSIYIVSSIVFLSISSQLALNPLSPHDALRHHFTSLKTHFIFLQQRVLEWKFSWHWFTNTWQFSVLFHPHQIIFIRYKSRIATAIHGL